MAPLAVAYALRGCLEARVVAPADPILRSRRQFFLELSLFFLSGMVMAFILLMLYHFPLMQSGMKLVLGIITVGIFAALDLALARERLVIEAAHRGSASFEPPRKLSPMTRKFSMVATLILLLVTGIIMLVLLRDLHWLASQEATTATIAFLNRSVLLEVGFVMGFLLLMVINLVFSYARNLRILFNAETTVLENVSQGDLTRQVPVTTNSELGVIAGHTNTMIRSLRDGVRMREGLLIASEVQQHFLPKKPPVIPGLEMAGTARFSDETGGDFFDFMECEQATCKEVGVMVGDVSGHGIGAALLMAASRALLRQSAVLAAPLAQRIGSANAHLSRDIGDTGRFLTLFFMLINTDNGSACWVNAGHQPPLLYDKATNEFTELKGQDIPLGVEASWQFHEHAMSLPTPGQVMLIGTDGAWEARNPHGEMFGNDRLQAVLKEAADKDAETILETVVNAVHEFTGQVSQEDDLTLVVIKGSQQ